MQTGEKFGDILEEVSASVLYFAVYSFRTSLLAHIWIFKDASSPKVLTSQSLFHEDTYMDLIIEPRHNKILSSGFSTR